MPDQEPHRPTRVVIDTDPGIDDAAAILLALAAPQVDVVGLTTVAGNSPLSDTTRNALRILELAGATAVPVAAGADRPLVQAALDRSDSVHGADGLGGVVPSSPSARPVEAHAADFLADVTQEAPVTLVAIGPLTNVALALAMHPEVVERIDHILLMGGARLEGNVTPAAEFNIWADPEAAARVFSSGIPLTVLPLDVTHQALLSPGELATMAAGGTVGSALSAMISFYERQHLDDYGEDFAPLHDVLAVLPLVVDSAITFEEAHASVDHGSSPSRGATLISTGGRVARANCRVGVHLDREAFAAALLGHVATLG